MASDDDDASGLKRLTVRELRERAVKSLGAKAAGLKTKQELLEALAPKAAAVAQPAPVQGELPVARDFFVDPRKPALPSAYGDDRLLVFRREPLAVVVSWDLSDATWGDARAVWLELVEPGGRLVARHDVGVQTGVATFEELPERTPIVPQVVRKGRVMTRGRAFSLGPLIEDQARFQMTVLWDEPLPAASLKLSSAAAEGASGPMPVVRAGRARAGALTSSRVTSGVPSSRVERGPASSRLR